MNELTIFFLALITIICCTIVLFETFLRLLNSNYQLFFLIRSRGFVLEGFPRNDDESRVLSMSGLFPDAAILLGVEDTDIVDRLLPWKLERWKVKRNKRLAEKAKQKAITSKAKVS
jgi:hypothetical protein